jgi:hypothetical protein
MLAHVDSRAQGVMVADNGPLYAYVHIPLQKYKINSAVSSYNTLQH